MIKLEFNHFLCSCYGLSGSFHTCPLPSKRSFSSVTPLSPGSAWAFTCVSPRRPQPTSECVSTPQDSAPASSSPSRLSPRGKSDSRSLHGPPQGDSVMTPDSSVSHPDLECSLMALSTSIPLSRHTTLNPGAPLVHASLTTLHQARNWWPLPLTCLMLPGRSASSGIPDAHFSLSPLLLL